MSKWVPSRDGLSLPSRKGSGVPATRVRYSEAFKRQEVSELEGGRQCRAHGIGGTFTVARWVRRYGTEDLLPGNVRVETLKERDELSEARKRI